MISPIEVAFVTACTALLSSCVSPLITLRMTRAQIRASVVSNNRQRWIETLRDLIASFCAKAAVTAPVRARVLGETGILASADAKALSRIEELIKTHIKITLMINPLEADHQDLVAAISRTVAALRASPLTDLPDESVEKLIEDVIVKSQAILKREWARVKRGE